MVDLADFQRDGTHTRDGARIAVTFDDGYVDNLTTALPLLEKYEIPATLFVVGNAVDRVREFWWDALQRALLEPDSLPESLEFPFGDGPHSFSLPPATGPEPQQWRADFDEPVTARQQVFRALWDAIVQLEPTAQDDAVDHLLTWAGQPLTPPGPRLPISGEQFASLAAHPLITLGSHTLDHVSLTDLPPAQQRRQIHEGHHRVAELAGHRPDRFSFPFGRLDDSALAAVRELGVEVACTSVPVPVTRGDDRHALPRLQATDLDGEAFARWLRDEHRLLLSESTLAAGSRQISEPGTPPEPR